MYVCMLAVSNIHADEICEINERVINNERGI